MTPQTSPRAEFRARYLVESLVPSEKAAEVIAGEQSSGTFLSLPGETEQLKERSRARVVRIDPLPPALQPTLASAFVARHGNPAVFQRAEIEIAFPVANVGPNLPTLLATVAGNLFELGEVTALRLLDLDLPADYAAQFQGPGFGIEGTRRQAGVFERPLIGTIIKPSIGLTPQQTADLVNDLCAAGIDFIKDDELIADPPYAPFDERLKAVMPVLRRPPSIVLITIGSVTGVSIAALFTGGLLPGVVLAITLIAVVWWRYRGEDLSAVQRATGAQIGKAFLIAVPAIALPFIIRAAVVEGVATASEVSTIGIVYGILAGLLVYRQFDFKRIYPMLVETASLSGAILLTNQSVV